MKASLHAIAGCATSLASIFADAEGEVDEEEVEEAKRADEEDEGEAEYERFS
jgi:hypothetical protein